MQNKLNSTVVRWTLFLSCLGLVIGCDARQANVGAPPQTPSRQWSPPEAGTPNAEPINRVPRDGDIASSRSNSHTDQASEDLFLFLAGSDNSERLRIRQVELVDHRLSPNQAQRRELREIVRRQESLIKEVVARLKLIEYRQEYLERYDSHVARLLENNDLTEEGWIQWRHVLQIPETLRTCGNYWYHWHTLHSATGRIEDKPLIVQRFDQAFDQNSLNKSDLLNLWLTLKATSRGVRLCDKHQQELDAFFARLPDSELRRFMPNRSEFRITRTQEQMYKPEEDPLSPLYQSALERKGYWDYDPQPEMPRPAHGFVPFSLGGDSDNSNAAVAESRYVSTLLLQCSYDPPSEVMMRRLTNLSLQRDDFERFATMVEFAYRNTGNPVAIPADYHPPHRGPRDEFDRVPLDAEPLLWQIERMYEWAQVLEAVEKLEIDAQRVRELLGDEAFELAAPPDGRFPASSLLHRSNTVLWPTGE